MENIGKRLITSIVILCIISALGFWAVVSLIDWLFIEDAIKSTKPITPEIELIVKDNVVDTLYIYHKP